MNDAQKAMKVNREVSVNLYGEPSIEQILVAIDTVRDEADKAFGVQETKESVAVVGSTRDGMYGVIDSIPVLVFRIEVLNKS